MRRTYRRRQFIKPIPGITYHVNREITARELRVIGENGENLGVIPTSTALERAESVGLDLVEVSPVANPPVAKILDFSQFKYQKDKETQKAKAKQKKQELKGVRLSPRIGAHDRDLRLDQARRFLDDGHKLKVELQLRGREHQYKDRAADIIDQFVEALRETYQITVEQPVQRQGGRLSLVCFSSGKHAPVKEATGEEAS